jgi:hypothetical protein
MTMAIEDFDSELAEITYQAEEAEHKRNGTWNSTTAGALANKCLRERQQHEAAVEQERSNAEAAAAQAAVEARWNEQTSQLSPEQIDKINAVPAHQRQGLLDAWSAGSAPPAPAVAPQRSPDALLGAALSRTTPPGERRLAASEFGLGLGKGVGLAGDLPVELRKGVDGE